MSVGKKTPRLQNAVGTANEVNHNMIQGEQSTNIESFRLKDTDVQEQRRNFSGYQVNQFFTMADLIQGDSEGTTETDAATAEQEGANSYVKGNGYTRINQKKGRSIL